MIITENVCACVHGLVGVHIIDTVYTRLYCREDGRMIDSIMVHT